jgi:hypothetical protein
VHEIDIDAAASVNAAAGFMSAAITQNAMHAERIAAAARLRAILLCLSSNALICASSLSFI